MSIKENVTGFQHLGIPTADIEKSLKFYCGIGLTISSSYEIKENGGTTKVAFLNLGDFCLELYQQSGRVLRKDFVPGPIDHLTFDVKDIDKTFWAVKAAGFMPQETAPVQLPLQKNGIKYFIILGPDGERVEFNQIL